MTGLYYRTPEGTKFLGYSFYYYLNDTPENSEYFWKLYYWDGDSGWFDKKDIAVLEEIKCYSEAEDEKQKLIQEIRRYDCIFVLREQLLDPDEDIIEED